MGSAVNVLKQLAARGFLRLRGPWPPGSTPKRGLHAHVPGYHAITHHPIHTSIYSLYELPVATVASLFSVWALAEFRRACAQSITPHPRKTPPGRQATQREVAPLARDQRAAGASERRGARERQRARALEAQTARSSPRSARARSGRIRARLARARRARSPRLSRASSGRRE